jgi:hypothetical protein
MNSRDRFRETMNYGTPDRVPYFEEGIRKEVNRAWRKQGMPRGTDPERIFPSDPRVEIDLDLEPRPKPRRWPVSKADLRDFRRRFDPDDPGRLPGRWPRCARDWEKSNPTVMLRVHRGLFLSMGVYGWERFAELMRLLIEDPGFVRKAMDIVGEFSAALAEKVLRNTPVDAAVFSEPIGGNDRPLLSPRMYEEIVLASYEPVLTVLRRYGVKTIIFRTYANARLLIPTILKGGFNCLWACEVNVEAMDYRSIRREFGRDLRLIGGIDLDALRLGKEAIRREILEKVPPLIADGGYVPLADGRVRADISFENYFSYRELLREVMKDPFTESVRSRSS